MPKNTAVSFTAFEQGFASSSHSNRSQQMTIPTPSMRKVKEEAPINFSALEEGQLKAPTKINFKLTTM
jgi:hypothetical protein